MKNKKKGYSNMRPLAKLILILLVASAVGLVYKLGVEFHRNSTLKKQLAEAQVRLQQVKDENAYLTSEKEKLEDPNYVASFARSNYLLSKADEQIFYLPEKEDN